MEYFYIEDNPRDSYQPEVLCLLPPLPGVVGFLGFPLKQECRQEEASLQYDLSDLDP